MSLSPQVPIPRVPNPLWPVAAVDIIATLHEQVSGRIPRRVRHRCGVCAGVRADAAARRPIDARVQSPPARGSRSSHVAGVLRQRAPAPVRAARDDAPRAVSLLVATATLEGFHLARAAATFGDLRGGYDVVLPDLEAAYVKAKSWTQAEFDPRAVARAELAWWVARRVPGQNSAEQIGGLIADEVRAAVRDDARPRRSRGVVARAGGRAARRPGRPARLGSNRPAAAPVLQRAALGALVRAGVTVGARG